MLVAKDLVYIGGSVLVSLMIGYILRLVFSKTRKPNGKRGGVVSFHVILGVALISSVAYLTKDYFYTGILAVLVYLIMRNKHESKQHYVYQLVLSFIIGILPVLGLVYKGYIKNRDQSNERMYSQNEMSEAMREAPDLDLHQYEKSSSDGDSDSEF